MKILITGAAGFLAYNLSRFLAEKNYNIIACDIINDMFEVHSKYLRLESLGFVPKEIKSETPVKSSKFDNLFFCKIDVSDSDSVNKLFDNNNFDIVFHFASREGIRNSLTKPALTVSVNIDGFVNVIDASKKHNIKHFIYASSSGVYGLNMKMPYSTKDYAGHPVSLLDATKRSNELIAHSYSYLFGLPTTGLRLFSVYGPFDRPDSIVFSTVKSVLNNNPINVSNDGENLIDLTFIDDITELLEKIISNRPQRKSFYTDVDIDFSTSSAPFKIYNIGSGRPITWTQFINSVEKSTGNSVEKISVTEQFRQISGHYADITDIDIDYSFKQKVHIDEGIELFVKWYKKYFQNNS
jgi:UDP-glucuronate 4-epimerase